MTKREVIKINYSTMTEQNKETKKGRKIQTYWEKKDRKKERKKKNNKQKGANIKSKKESKQTDRHKKKARIVYQTIGSFGLSDKFPLHQAMTNWTEYFRGSLKLA
jgi:hypothetical protein